MTDINKNSMDNISVASKRYCDILIRTQMDHGIKVSELNSDSGIQFEKEPSSNYIEVVKIEAYYVKELKSLNK